MTMFCQTYLIELLAVDATNDENLEPKANSEQLLSLVSNKDLMKKLNITSYDNFYVKKLLQQIKSIDDDHSSKPKTSSETGKPFKKGEFYVGRIEIGKPGSGIKLDELQWVTALSKNLPAHMVKSLLPCLFNLEVLLDSNYKGGAPKNKTAGDNTVQRKGLDPKIIEALKYTINKTYPRQMNDSAFGQAVNSKITSLRYQVSQQVDNKQTNVSTDD